VFKRVFNLADDKGKLLLVSDNRQYAPYTVDASDVLEIWSAKAFFTNQFPDAQMAPAPVTDNMAHTIVQLQEEISRLKRKAN